MLAADAMAAATRRDFLLCALALAAAPLPRGRTPGAPARGEPRALLRRLLDRTGRAEALGRALLAGDPGLADGARALEALLRARGVRNARGLRALLARRRDLDFARARVVVADGWVLARTEAEACALLALA